MPCGYIPITDQSDAGSVSTCELASVVTCPRTSREEQRKKREKENETASTSCTEEGPRGEQWEKVGNWTQGEKRGRVSGVSSAPLPLSAQEDP
eukprot:1182646-Prorocentrum_minimum.AAC.2